MFQRSVLLAFLLHLLPLPLIMAGGVPQIAAYIADQEIPNRDELFVVDLATGSSSKVNDPLVPLGGVRNFRIDPKGKFIVYLADQDTFGVLELYYADLVTGEVDKLNPPVVSGGSIHSFQLSRKGDFIVYTAQQYIDNVSELFHVNLKSREVTQISQPLVSSGYIDQYEITANGTGVCYRGIINTAGTFELYYYNFKSETYQRLNPPYVSGQSLRDFGLDKPGKAAIYRAYETPGIDELFRVDLKSFENTRINSELVAGGDVKTFSDTDAKGQALLYTADQEVNDQTELYLADLKKQTNSKVPLPIAPGRVLQRAYLDPTGLLINLTAI